MSEQTEITDVADTSLWVAYYRAEETERGDALFKDPFARRLIGEDGARIANDMQEIGHYVRSAVVMRTLIIDRFIEDLVRGGVTTVINLGAGLDARPYRMNLPPELRWIEVDHPRIVGLKNERLAGDRPKCRLERHAVDLADDAKRKQFLTEACQGAGRVLVLTEGVIIYLTEDQVRGLARDLSEQPNVEFWIAEYFDPRVYKHLKTRVRTQKFKNAPIQFLPVDWFGFFAKLGWEKKELRYMAETSLQNGRPLPMPWWGQLFMRFLPKKTRQRSLRMTGYVVFQKVR